MSNRSWWSNLQGVADSATGNIWDFDNLGRPNSSVADNKPPGFSGNNSSGGYDSQFGKWADSLNKAKMYNQIFGSNKSSVSPSTSQSFDSTGGSYKKLSGSSGMYFPAGSPGFQVVHSGGVSQGGGGGGSNPLSAAVSGIGTYGALASNPVTAPIAVAGGIISGLGSLFG